MGLYEGDITRVIALLQREGRVTYWALQQEFGFDEAFLEGLRRELLFKGIARDEAGLGLVWTGSVSPVGHPTAAVPAQPALAESSVHPTLSSLPPLVVGPATRAARSTPVPPQAPTASPEVEPLTPAPPQPLGEADGVPLAPARDLSTAAATPTSPATWGSGRCAACARP